MPSPSPIEQGPLRELKPNERIVRCAGLKFILPCPYKPGDTLDEESAAFINAAYHTAVLNGFTPIRHELLADPRTAYEDLDRELQAFADTYKRATRKADASDASSGKTQEEKDLYAYARPIYNHHMGRKHIPRKLYEAGLTKYINENRASLTAAMNKEKASMRQLTSRLIDLLKET